VVFFSDLVDNEIKNNVKKIWYNKKGKVDKIEILFHGYSKHTIKRKNKNEYIENVRIIDMRLKKYNKLYKKVSLRYKIFSKLE
jgi:hypothetical protein